ncbi:TIGR03086 family metal-binding protein [Pseudonocardia sp.]|uniref:TIGR03086 family metal-binding protein n=1 Tax=Pseudonocardia sp. TaxID=60912 RepID=UPI003D1371E3
MSEADDGADTLDGIVARFRRRAEAFGATVAAVSPDRWADPSPCAEWTARDVVGHVVDMHQAVLKPVGRALSPAPSVDDDPLAAFLAARADVESMLADPEVAGRPVDTPMGRATAAGHVDAVVSTDMVLHRWDLARATGQDDTIDPAEVERLWPTMSTMPEMMRTPEAFGPGIVVFGPVVPVPGDAPLQDRLLGAAGRDPHFTPR